MEPRAANDTKGSKHLSKSGYLAKGGQIIDATIIQAPRQHNSQDEKAAIKAGEIPEDWKDKPAKLAQKDRDARWTVKYSKAKAATRQHDIAIPIFGCKNHAGIDRAQLRNVVPKVGRAVTKSTSERRHIAWRGGVKPSQW